MLRAGKKQKGTSVARLEAQGTETKNYTIEDVVRLVIVNNMPTSMALAACFLEDSVPYSTIYSCVKARRMQGTYDGLIRKRLDNARLELGLIPIIDTTAMNEEDTNTSPVTINTADQSRAPSFSSKTSSAASQLAASLQPSSRRKQYRNSSKQSSIGRLDAKVLRMDYNERFKAAWKDSTNLVAAGNTGEPVEEICLRLNKEYNLDGNRQLRRSTVYQAVKDGRAGISPKKKGPPPKIPVKLLEVVAAHAEVCQVGDVGELKSQDMKCLIGASIIGTPYEGKFHPESVWRKLITEFPESLQAANKLSLEDARASWTTYDNLNQWFDDVKKDLIQTGLVEDREELDKDGEMVSEVVFKQDCKRRFINMDETQHNLSKTGDRGGLRNISYHNPKLQRGASRKVKAGRHVTGVYATNADGEALPPFYIFDSTAKCEDNFCVNTDWLVGLPSIIGRFGCPTNIESGSYYAVRSRGSMDEEFLNQYIEMVIVPLYPNMNKTAIFDSRTGKLNQGPVILKVDAGPGRIVSSEAVLARREELFERGLIILLGLPNATSVQQEMDALYGPFKTATYARGEKVVQRKMKERGLARRSGQQLIRNSAPAVLNLDFSDLATIVNGTATDAIDDKPFDVHFTKEKILWLWAKIGFVPFTRSCLQNKRVRKELGQHDKDEALEDLQFRYNVLVDNIEEAGFNPGVFDAEIPSAVHVQREATEEAQAEELVKSGKAFSASGQWNFCESRIGNAGATLRAQKKQLKLNEIVRQNVSNKKSEAQLKTLQRAQAALAKHEIDAQLLTEKDWGDVVRWVLPAAKVPFLLKDLKKRDQIVAKLATLPNDWTTYIPRVAVVPIIPPTAGVEEEV